MQFPFLGTKLCLAQPNFTTHSNIALSKTAALRQHKCSGTRQQKAGLLHLGKAPTLATEQDGWKHPACCATALSWMCSMPSVFISSLPGRTTTPPSNTAGLSCLFPQDSPRAQGKRNKMESPVQKSKTQSKRCSRASREPVLAALRENSHPR